MKHESTILEQLPMAENRVTKLNEARAILNNLYGSVKLKRKRMSKGERDKLAIKFTEEDSKKISKEFLFRD